MSGNLQICRIRADGSDPTELGVVVEGPLNHLSPVWSFDNAWIAFARETGQGTGLYEIWIARANTTTNDDMRRRSSDPEGFSHLHPRWSFFPGSVSESNELNGRWLVYERIRDEDRSAIHRSLSSRDLGLGQAAARALPTDTFLVSAERCNYALGTSAPEADRAAWRPVLSPPASGSWVSVIREDAQVSKFKLQRVLYLGHAWGSSGDASAHSFDLSTAGVMRGPSPWMWIRSMPPSVRSGSP